MNQRELENSGESSDAPKAEYGDVAALLGALPRVEAPKNFEFGVRARIAKGSPRRASLVPLWKVAAPSSLVLAAAAVLMFYQLAPTPNETAAVVDPAPKVTSEPQRPLSLNDSAPARDTEPQVAKPIDGQLIASAKGRRIEAPPVRRATRVAVVKSEGKGSFDTEIKPANVITAPGFESTNPNNGNSNSNNVQANVSVREVFEMLGISADPVDAGWKVRSLMADSIASRAKVRLGDVVEAIDGQQLKGNSLAKGSATVLTVRREGKSITLSLK